MKGFRGASRRCRWHLRLESGFSLADTLIGVLILGVCAVAFVSALSTTSIAAGEMDRQAIAQSLARSQLETTKAAAYDPVPSTYPTISVPAGWSVTVTASAITEAIGTDVQRITVAVSQGATVVTTIEDFKVNR